jgi:AcrR family transcriptional regulator
VVPDQVVTVSELSTGERTARDRAVAALVASATELFSERGPAGVSLREVASHAELNYGLIHHYVGSKEELIRLVIEQVTSSASRRFGEATGTTEVLDILLGPPAGGQQYPRFLAWAILEGRDPKELAGPTPALPRLIDMLPGTDPNPDLDDDPRLRAAAVTALALGWQIFGEFVTRTAELEGVDSEDLHAAVRTLMASIAER